MTPSKRLSPEEFVQTFLPFAKEAEQQTGISAIAILVQAAWESGWNSASPGWMFFGEKDHDGINGNEQLLVTTEYHSSTNVKYPEVISVTPVIRNGRKMFKYKVRDYFRKYATPAECFIEHGRFFLRNPRYGAALQVKHDPARFFEKIAAAGYATDPNYANNLKSLIPVVEKYIPKG